MEATQRCQETKQRRRLTQKARNSGQPYSPQEIACLVQMIKQAFTDAGIKLPLSGKDQFKKLKDFIPQKYIDQVTKHNQNLRDGRSVSALHSQFYAVAKVLLYRLAPEFKQALHDAGVLKLTKQQITMKTK